MLHLQHTQLALTQYIHHIRRYLFEVSHRILYHNKTTFIDAVSVFRSSLFCYVNEPFIYTTSNCGSNFRKQTTFVFILSCWNLVTSVSINRQCG